MKGEEGFIVICKVCGNSQYYPNSDYDYDDVVDDNEEWECAYCVAAEFNSVMDIAKKGGDEFEIALVRSLARFNYSIYRMLSK